MCQTASRWQQCSICRFRFVAPQQIKLLVSRGKRQVKSRGKSQKQGRESTSPPPPSFCQGCVVLATWRSLFSVPCVLVDGHVLGLICRQKRSGITPIKFEGGDAKRATGTPHAPRQLYQIPTGKWSDSAGTYQGEYCTSTAPVTQTSNHGEGVLLVRRHKPKMRQDNWCLLDLARVVCHSLHL